MACEKCWADAFHLSRVMGCFESQSDAYTHLLIERAAAGAMCMPEEICGVGTTEMHTVHVGETKCACGRVSK